MQFEIYQWLVPLMGIFFIFRTIRGYVKGNRNTGSTIIWIIFWITAMVLAIIPNEISFKLASMLGFKSNINAVLFVATGFLFILVFYLSSTIDKLEHKLTELTRKIAIERQDLLEDLPQFKTKPKEDIEKPSKPNLKIK